VAPSHITGLYNGAILPGADSMTDQNAKFFPGQQVEHLVFNYRGVVFDVDPIFLGSEAWYDQMAKSRPPKEAPWCHVLVDGEDHTTYVAEGNLAPYSGREMIVHPLVDTHFDDFTDGVYHSRVTSN